MSEKKQTPGATGRRTHSVRRRAAGSADPQRRAVPRRRRAVRRRSREVGRARRGRRQPRRRPSSRSSPSAIRRRTIPGADDLYPVGCAARVLKALKHSSGNYSLILQGLTRIRLDDGHADRARTSRRKITRLDEPATEDVEAEALAHEPARHRQAGHPAHARAAARGGLAHRLDPGARRARRSRRREPRRAGRREGAAARDGRREGAHPQGAAPAHAPARDPEDARAHQLPDQGGDGQEPARVRAPPAAQGDQGGARRGRRRSGRSRRARGAHRQGEPARPRPSRSPRSS